MSPNVEVMDILVEQLQIHGFNKYENRVLWAYSKYYAHLHCIHSPKQSIVTEMAKGYDLYHFQI